MKYSLFAPCLLSAALAACGGGGGGGDSAPPSSLAATSPAFVAPAAGATFVYAETLNDNLNNTLNRILVETILARNPDGSFTIATRDPSNNTVHLGAENYTYYPTVGDYENTGRAKQIVTSYPNGTSGTCIFSPTDPAAGRANTWNFTYTKTCGAGNPVAYTESGSYLGTETITVPAGTFNTDKFQVTDSWTNAAGTTTTETTIKWRNSGAPDSMPVKRVINVTYSGTAARPNSLVSLTQVLQSRQ